MILSGGDAFKHPPLSNQPVGYLRIRIHNNTYTGTLLIIPSQCLRDKCIKRN